jgi:hypothetical protein
VASCPGTAPSCPPNRRPVPGQRPRPAAAHELLERALHVFERRKVHSAALAFLPLGYYRITFAVVSSRFSCYVGSPTNPYRISLNPAATRRLTPVKGLNCRHRAVETHCPHSLPLGHANLRVPQVPVDAPAAAAAAVMKDLDPDATSHWPDGQALRPMMRTVPLVNSPWHSLRAGTAPECQADHEADAALVPDWRTSRRASSAL